MFLGQNVLGGMGHTRRGIFLLNENLAPRGTGSLRKGQSRDQDLLLVSCAIQCSADSQQHGPPVLRYRQSDHNSQLASTRWPLCPHTRTGLSPQMRNSHLRSRPERIVFFLHATIFPVKLHFVPVRKLLHSADPSRSPAAIHNRDERLPCRSDTRRRKCASNSQHQKIPKVIQTHFFEVRPIVSLDISAGSWNTASAGRRGHLYFFLSFGPLAFLSAFGPLVPSQSLQ